MAKEIISVTVKAQKADPITAKSDLLAVGVFSDAKRDRLCEAIDERLGGAIAKVRRLGDFKAKANTSALLYGDGKIGAQRVLLVGLGERKKATNNTVRGAAVLAASKAVELRAGRAVLALHNGFARRPDAAGLGRAIAEGAHFGSYRYDEFVTKNEDGRLKELIAIVADANAAKVAQLAKGVRVGSIIGRAQSFSRTIANRPGNVMNPAALAASAKKVARETAQLSCTVFDEKQLKQKKMGGILAVGSGSVNKPRLIVLKYAPVGKKAARATIGLVGKAITFDSGGISIKPAAGMQEMKLDMSGGAAVLGALKAAAELKLDLNVYGIIPSAENLPSGTSYRPGDIVTTYSGKTVEVQNTDAEGRMLLCDALHYAVEQKCDVIVDIATLTGACIVALGKHKGGLMGNDAGLIKQLQAAAEASGEKVWHMPSGEEYLEEMKSKIADLKNIGNKWGGACTAAAFLGQFVGDMKWAHIDMAPMEAMFEGGKKSGVVGSRGFGVRLLTTYLMNAAK
ncbi:MAG: leucyl aminopeptidase [Planctomycetota bacterium]|nr:MAG: leucyl aminopeptidase [Planctomycetota bacterium]